MKKGHEFQQLYHTMHYSNSEVIESVCHFTDINSAYFISKSNKCCCLFEFIMTIFLTHNKKILHIT